MEARQARRWATDLKDHTFLIASLFTGTMTFFKVSKNRGSSGKKAGFPGRIAIFSNTGKTPFGLSVQVQT